MAYETTTVDVGRSQEAIRRLLYRFDAAEFRFSEGSRDGHRYVSVEFLHKGFLVRVISPLTDIETEAKERASNSRTRKSLAQLRAELMDREHRRIWRVVHWYIKAKLEAIEEGLVEFEQEFLPHLVDVATDETVWTRLQPGIAEGRLQVADSHLLPAPGGVR